MINNTYETKCPTCGNVQSIGVCNNCKNTTYHWDGDWLQCINPACRNQWLTWKCNKCKTQNRFKETLVRQHRGMAIAFLIGSFFACGFVGMLSSNPDSWPVALTLFIAAILAAFVGFGLYSSE